MNHPCATITRNFLGSVALVVAMLMVGYVLDSALFTFAGVGLGVVWAVVVGALIFGRHEQAQPVAGPAVPPPLQAAAVAAMPNWNTPDQIFESMILGPDAEPPPDVDPDTGELLGDRVCRIEEVLGGMERTIEQLGNLIGEQSNLMANGLLELRRRVDTLTPEPEQQQLPLRQVS